MYIHIFTCYHMYTLLPMCSFQQVPQHVQPTSTYMPKDVLKVLLVFAVTCPQGTILQKCDCEPIGHCDGSWFTSMTKCTAYNNYFGRGIRVCISFNYYYNNQNIIQKLGPNQKPIRSYARLHCRCL